MNNHKKGFAVPFLLTMISVLLIGVGVFLYNYKNVVPEISVQTTEQATSSPTGICPDFGALSDFVLKNIEQPDVKKDIEDNIVYHSGLKWKRKASEPYITYPFTKGIEANYGGMDKGISIDEMVLAIQKDSELLTPILASEAQKLGMTTNELNSVKIKSYLNKDINQTFGFTKGEYIYSVVLDGQSMDHQAPPLGTVRITCGQVMKDWDNLYNALNLKADPAEKNSYSDDYVAMGDISPDKKVYAVLGSPSQIRIADYYYFDGMNYSKVASGYYPAECKQLEIKKVGLGIRCYDSTGPAARTVSY